MQGNPRQCWIVNLTLWIPDSGYWIQDFLSVRLGFWIPIVRGIPDSLSCIPGPDSKIRDSTSKLFQISDSSSKIFPDSGI